MAKFNVVQKRRRAAISAAKRAQHGDPSTRKLKARPQPQSVSGKRQRKILKKWRRDQKEAVEKGLVSMEDVEMAAESTSQEAKKTSINFPLKKSLKLKQQLKKKKGKSKKAPKGTAKASAEDAMVE